MTRKLNWRLILSQSGDNGAWNMALDEAILKSAAEKKSPPTLRLYNWQPATLSLGFAQSSRDVNIEHLQEQNWGLVRRPTGGRAILHTDELTYSVSAPIDDPLLAGNLLESYRKISRALLAALANLKVDAVGEKVYANGVSSGTINPICFETPSNYEITADGKKLIGSAQARKYDGLLQHGALPIRGDITRITKVLRYESEAERISAAEKLSAHATTLERLLGTAPGWQTVADAVLRGFSDVFAISFTESQPSQEELDHAKHLEISKYDTPEWTFRI